MYKAESNLGKYMNRHKEYDSQEAKPDLMRISNASTSVTQHKEAKSMSPTTGPKKFKKLASNQNILTDTQTNSTDKDEFGIIHKLKSVINSKYQV